MKKRFSGKRTHEDIPECFGNGAGETCWKTCRFARICSGWYVRYRISEEEVSD